MGYLGLLGSKARLAGPLASAGVILLLFLMGAKIGFDEEIMGSLAVMGLQAWPCCRYHRRQYFISLVVATSGETETKGEAEREEA